MHGQKNSNLVKAVAFFLIAIILTVFIAFSASGWQENENERPQIDNSTSVTPPSEENVDENTEGPSNNNTTNPNDIIEATKHYLTGKEINKSEAKIMPFAILVDSLAPLYGFSNSYTTIEIPVEGGKTRYLIITDDAESIGKIGSICSTRTYIDDIAGFFSTLLLYHGRDDKFLYPSVIDNTNKIDLSSISGYCYSEQGKYVYTNGDLISALLTNHSITRESVSTLTAPFVPGICDENEKAKISNTISISYSDENITKIIYDVSTGSYSIRKNSSNIIDLHNGKSPLYDGALILSIDSTTKDTESATELILDTKAGGRGYYATDGIVIDVTWSVDEAGQMTIYNDGQVLSTTKGTTYISFVKSSQIADILFN